MKQAVTWLKQSKNLLQKDIAEKMGMSEVAFSNGMKRIQQKFDEDFIIKFHQATDEIFSLEWLMDGTGPKFTEEIEKPRPQPTPINVDFSSYINALIAKSDETIASLKRELAAKDDIIEAKDKIITSLEQLAEERMHRIAELRKVIDSNNLTDYLFPVGSAEGNKQLRP
jgi:transcriptional regulator with XRE-family HTH domain